jgi:hypothetical protein
MYFFFFNSDDGTLFHIEARVCIIKYPKDNYLFQLLHFFIFKQNAIFLIAVFFLKHYLWRHNLAITELQSNFLMKKISHFSI